METKNGAVIRKHMGYSHIRADHAERMQQFYKEHFNPYLNFHRPCAQPEVQVDPKGRTRRIYRRYQTPLETLLSLPQPAQYLRAGFTVDTLNHMAAASSDTEAARGMQEAKRKLFDRIASTG